MKKRITHWFMLVAGAIGVTTSAFADTIACVADPVSGVYCGTGYKISVSVSKPSSGATIELSETGGDGTWVAADAFAGYKDACTDKPMYYKVTATGYADATGSANVTVTPKTLTDEYVWAVLPPEEYYTYDGTEKKPSAACGDGEPSIITENDFTISYQDNVNAGTAKVIFTGKNNYAGTVEEEFEIRKAKGWIGGDEPGTGVVPPGGISKYDATAMYDGQWHTINTNALKTVTKEGFSLSFEYALAEEGPYAIEPILFKDVTVTSIWYKICLNNSNYEDYTHQAKVTVTNRPVTVTSGTKLDFTYDGNPHAYTNLTVTAGSFVAGEGIATSNWVTVTTVAEGQVDNAFDYAPLAGTKLENYDFSIVTGKIAIAQADAEYASFTGSIAWKLNLGSGCYTAQLKLTCTNGLSQGISNLRFIYQDRTSGSAIASALYNSSARTYRQTANYSGTTYRYVDLDTSRITSENVVVLYGVKDVSQVRGVISASECLIELYVKSLASPVSDLGYVVWSSNGSQCMMPITASGGSQGVTVRDALKVAKLAASASMLSAPLSMSALNTSMALGVVLDPSSVPYCKLTDFTVGDGGISGRVEVGKENAGGTQTQGTLGTNARAVLMGAKNLIDGFSVIGGVSVDESGAFQFELGSKDYRFFRVRIDAENVVE